MEKRTRDDEQIPLQDSQKKPRLDPNQQTSQPEETKGE